MVVYTHVYIEICFNRCPYCFNGTHRFLHMHTYIYNKSSRLQVTYTKVPMGQGIGHQLCHLGFKPFLKARFRTMEESIAMYEEYTQLAGFCMCLETSKRETNICISSFMQFNYNNVF
ncbi:hypothetical protein Hanom_Chr05g00408871 [Helianthus anomalus]